MKPKAIVYRLGYTKYVHPGNEIRLEMRSETTWTIVQFGNCLNKISGEWELERLPSSRPKSFLEETRFSSKNTAIRFWENWKRDRKDVL